jgi:hypothetical protein
MKFGIGVYNVCDPVTVIPSLSAWYQACSCKTCMELDQFSFLKTTHHKSNWYDNITVLYTHDCMSIYILRVTCFEYNLLSQTWDAFFNGVISELFRRFAKVSEYRG